MEKNISLNCVLKNIKQAHSLSKQNNSIQIVVVISGSQIDCSSWLTRFNKTAPHIFNNDGSTKILSFQEKSGNKKREGNFLGTLLAYTKMKKILNSEDLAYTDCVTLFGMIFGRGERMSPFTQIEGNRKPGIIVSSQNIGNKIQFAAIEEALLYFVPVARYLESRGFRGVLDKWGDETEIASIDLTEKPINAKIFSEYDIIKFISLMNITEEYAKQKDWIVIDSNNNMRAILSRNSKNNLINQLENLGIKANENGNHYAGVSLGPVAMSYKVLEIAYLVFKEDILKEGIYIDFDPYFFMAMLIDDTCIWKTLISRDRNLENLVNMIPDFYEKVIMIKKIFEKKYGRKLNLKVIDLGKKVYWADIGQHRAMRKKYMSLLNDGSEGIIARRLEYIPDKKDNLGNIIINAKIDASVKVKNSVIINSTLTGKGLIQGSVIKDSILHDPEITGAFTVLSIRPKAKTVLMQGSGLYRSIGNKEINLSNGMRHGTLITKSGPVDMFVSEDTDLRNREQTYNIPIFGNKISFSEAFNLANGLSEEEIKKLRNDYISEIFSS